MLELKNQTDIESLKEENDRLLVELETAYSNMVQILDNSEKEMEIAYHELDKRYQALEELYSTLSNKENMLIHLEKLSSIGQFITEIIHELNNPLTVISAMADLTLMDPDLDNKVFERIKKIPRQVLRMSNYLKRFKNMAYKGEESFSVFDLKENITEYLATIEIIRPKSVVISSQFCEEKLEVFGDPYQIMQIFLNLAKNAFDAMQESGKNLSLFLSPVDKKWLKNKKNTGSNSCRDEEEWEEILKNNNNFALVEFKDDGSGIPENIVNNIFEAFFTTKGRGKGTGLGLSIATDVTKRHNANLYIKSQLGKGTTFLFVIPLFKR